MANNRLIKAVTKEGVKMAFFYVYHEGEVCWYVKVGDSVDCYVLPADGDYQVQPWEFHATS